MARMIPDVDPTEIEHTSEELVYRALRDQLPNDFTVLHSYPWLRPWRGENTLLEGEADFIVLHPKYGLLVLEVKGGENIRHDGQKWFRDTNQGPKEFQDPFLQARKNMHALLDIAKERSGGRIQKGQLIHGYAVVFPHMDYRGLPPPNADKAIVIGLRHMPFIKDAILTAFSAWTEEPKNLQQDQFQMLLNNCLMPKFRIFRPIGPDINETSEKLLELTIHQAQVFEGLYLQDRVLVEGVAGSGKTFLALQRALSFARCGKRTLFICYNKELAAWIRRQIDEDTTTQDFRFLLLVRNFHALAAELAASAKIPFKPARGGLPDEVFWDDEVPDLLEQSVFSLELENENIRFEALVVDEAQDFSLGWWYALSNSLLETPESPIYAFMDPNQSLRGEVTLPPIDFASRFRLNVNCRNTRKIAAASASILDIDHKVFSRAPVGVQPRILRCNTSKQQKGLVLDELHRLFDQESVTANQIAIIGPSAKANGSLADVDKVCGMSLITSAETWRDGKGILVTTARSFKGLESDIVIIYDLNDFGKLFRKEDLYVACTRARVLLIAVVHGDEIKELIEHACSLTGG